MVARPSYRPDCLFLRPPPGALADGKYSGAAGAGSVGKRKAGGGGPPHKRPKAAEVGFGRVVALYYHCSTSCQIC